MTHTTSQQNAAALRAALETPDASHRLQAALSAGTRPDPEFIDVLVARCAVEPDFFVRDMLTWALVRQDRAPTPRRSFRGSHPTRPRRAARPCTPCRRSPTPPSGAPSPRR
ncbi:HEAT repeat domain-containing protein [Microbacterium kunmingense]|uniref:HEAT repeat domain-containing protein n=1 Tax=Microbacterium kunmingense TaxID=2915939 RepID=UPI0027E32293|nr:HEAT repeat domain-containing protein [Microbacterium kunmingense]